MRKYDDGSWKDEEKKKNYYLQVCGAESVNNQLKQNMANENNIYIYIYLKTNRVNARNSDCFLRKEGIDALCDVAAA